MGGEGGVMCSATSATALSAEAEAKSLLEAQCACFVSETMMKRLTESTIIL